jgi:methionyl-tRNA formyltransferase
MSELRIGFAGDRDIAVSALKFVLEQNVRPVTLLVADQTRATRAEELRTLCGYLGQDDILEGTHFRELSGIDKLRSLNLDYILGVHFPYLVPADVLRVSRYGFLNLHPAYLPYNRGWHTPSWAILEGTPAGATLHFMDEGLDTGDIIHQKQVSIDKSDTANTLYARIKELELQVLQEAWPQLATCGFNRCVQHPRAGTFHRRADLFQLAVQRIELDEPTTARDLFDRLRGLTTNQINEAAYFEENGIRYRIQLRVEKELTTIATAREQTPSTRLSRLASAGK